jgi:hypothetical protein
MVEKKSAVDFLEAKIKRMSYIIVSFTFIIASMYNNKFNHKTFNNKKLFIGR